MPFWSRSRLSDDELRDVVAFVVDIASRAPTEDPVQGDDDGATAGEGDDDDGGDGDSDVDDGERTCGSDHPRVGQSGTFELPGGTFHDVAGEARVVDDCTIELSGFHYDGGGIDVRIYGGKDGEFGAPVGFALSEDLLGMRFDGDTLRVSLPPDKTLDDLDAVSVWCTAVGQDFGHAELQ